MTTLLPITDRSRPETPWTEDTTAKLRRLWDDGCSARQIGNELGLSRNAVLGKAHRLGLPERKQGGARTPVPKWHEMSREEKARRQERARLARIRSRLLGLSIVPLPEPEPIPEDISDGVTFEQLQWGDGRCRYPRGENPPFLYCGRTVKPEQSYCSTCYDITHQKAPLRKSDPAPARFGARMPVTALRGYGA